ncbi:hypothetical protein TGPRC2_259700B, partial [Toxoplasma gondii TgCatPRC2]
ATTPGNSRRCLKWKSRRRCERRETPGVVMAPSTETLTS